MRKLFLQKKFNKILIISLFASKDLFALVASDIDMSSASADVATIVASLISFLVLLMGYKKVLSLLGR